MDEWVGLWKKRAALSHCPSELGTREAANLPFWSAWKSERNARIVRSRRQRMEPIRNTKSIRFVRLKMYREDLDALVGLFQKACSVITISDDTNRYDSLAEMKQYVGSRIKDFNIRGENPNVHFLLNKSEKVPSSTPGQMMTQLFPELRTEDATDAADNLFYAAKEVIHSAQQTVITPLVFIFSILLVVGLLSWGFQGISTGNRGLPVLWIVLGGLDLIFIMIWSNRGHYLTLDTRLESPSFFQKYKEEFGKQAVTAVISGIICGLIGYLFGHFLKN
jgi:hypothetical protein